MSKIRPWLFAAALLLTLTTGAEAQDTPAAPVPSDTLIADTLRIAVPDTAPAPEPGIDRGRPKKSTTGAVFRSLAIPGWGQLYTENPIKAAVFLVAETALMASISWQNDRMRAALRSAEVSRELSHTAPTDTLRRMYARLETEYRETEYFHRDNRNELFWWLAGTILLSMGDAYVNAHLYGTDWSPELTLNHGTVGLTVTCKF